MPTTYIQQLLTFVDVCIGLAGWLVGFAELFEINLQISLHFTS